MSYTDRNDNSTKATKQLLQSPTKRKNRIVKKLKTYSVVYKCLNSDNVQSFYCCTNFDKSTVFKKILKADNDEEWCGSAGKLFHGCTTLLLKKMFIYFDTTILRKWLIYLKHRR